MVDVSEVIIRESIVRMMERVLDEVEIVLPPDCPMQERIGPEQMEKLAALNITMARIIQSVNWN